LLRGQVAFKGKSDIGDQINKKIIAPLANANRLSDFPDFNDATKLGSGKEMVDRLTNLVAIFENPALDFSKNRADGEGKKTRAGPATSSPSPSSSPATSPRSRRPSTGLPPSWRALPPDSPSWKRSRVARKVPLPIWTR